MKTIGRGDKTMNDLTLEEWNAADLDQRHLWLVQGRLVRPEDWPELDKQAFPCKEDRQ